jgi:chromosome segregation ATPase
MDLDHQISDLKKKLEDLKTRKIQNETRLKSLEQEKQQLLEECKALNTDPQKIEAVIIEQERVITDEVTKLQFELGRFNGSLGKS